MSIQTVKIPFVGDNGETLFTNFANPDAETTAIQVLGSASISAAQSKFYGDQSDGSLALSGTNGNGIYIPTHKGLEQISGSFHISAYVYLSSLTISELFAFGDTAHVTLNAAGDVEFSSTTGNWTAITGAGLASINTWHHVAVTATGTAAYLFFDGTLVGSANITATQAQNKGFYIGANLHSQSPINGYVQDFLIETQGTLPIAAFTVPDAQAGILSGKVKNELAVELPNKKVCIHRQSDGMLLSRTDSDANGDFSAWGILPAENHYIVGIGAPTETPDILSHKESVILTPTPTPTPAPAQGYKSYRLFTVEANGEPGTTNRFAELEFYLNSVKHDVSSAAIYESSHFSANVPANVFDSDPNTRWVSATSGNSYVGIVLNTDIVIDEYRITSSANSGDNNTAPNEFMLQSTTDIITNSTEFANATWINLDSRIGESTWPIGETRSYAIS